MKTGMSGSPVIRKYDFDVKFVNGDLMFNKASTDIVRIYSGRERASSDKHETELGDTWRIDECLGPILKNH